MGGLAMEVEANEEQLLTSTCLWFLIIYSLVMKWM